MVRDLVTFWAVTFSCGVFTRQQSGKEVQASDKEPPRIPRHLTVGSAAPDLYTQGQ